MHNFRLELHICVEEWQTEKPHR